jgi:hypothetical protein
MAWADGDAHQRVILGHHRRGRRAVIESHDPGSQAARLAGADCAYLRDGNNALNEDSELITKACSILKGLPLCDKEEVLARRVDTYEQHPAFCRLNYRFTGSAIWNNGGDCISIFLFLVFHRAVR